MIYVTLQTGVIVFCPPEAPSNYACFAVHSADLEKVKLGIQNAGPMLDNYQPEFLSWLNKAGKIHRTSEVFS